jgi:endoglucanase
VLPRLKTLPGWFLESYYPADQRDAENVPAANEANLLKPASYIAQAKLVFQFAARYGQNKKIDPALLAGVLTGPIYPTAPEVGSRTREVGLGYIRYVECENERDKWRKGRKAYQTARICGQFIGLLR